MSVPFPSCAGIKMLFRRKYLIVFFLLGILISGCGTSDQGEPTPTEMPPPVSVGPLPPALVEASPMPGSEMPLMGTVTYYFNQPMDRPSVEAALSGEPELTGSFHWLDDASVSFTPSGPWLPDTELTITVGETAQALNGLTMQEPVSLAYKTVGYLKLTQSLPEGGTFDVDPTSAIVAAFNRPVVPLGADPDTLPPAFSIDPPAPGRGEWLNTSTYIFYPIPGMDGGITYTVRLNPGLSSTDDAPLEDAAVWSFSTAVPRLVSLDPDEGDRHVRLDADINLTFNQPMDRGSVEDNLSLLDSSGQPVAGSSEWDEDSTHLSFVPDGLFERGVRYTILLSAEAKGRGGTSLEQALRVEFDTVGELGILKTRPVYGEEKTYYSPVTLTFNAPLDVDDPSDYISIEPALSLNFDWYSNSIQIFGDFEAERDYVLRVSGSLRDIWGDSLGEDYLFAFRTAPMRPRFMTSSYLAGGVMFVDPDDPVIFAQAVNVSNVTVSVGSISLPDFFRLNSSDGYDERMFFTPAGEEVYQVPLEISSNTNRVVRIPLTSDGSGLAPGVYLYSTFAAEAADYYGGGDSAVFSVVSHVNLVYKVSATDVLVWAVDTRTNTSIAGGAVVFYSEDGLPIASGHTNESGVFTASIPVQEDRYALSYAVLGNPGEDTFSLATSAWDDGIGAWEFGYRLDTSPPRTFYYLYTDRPIYRPGQTVNFRVVARHAHNGRYQFPETTSVPITIFDYRGMEISSLTLPLTDFGTVSGTYTIPSAAGLGYYRIQAGDDYYDTLFQVAEYRKPEIDLEVNFQKDDFIIGEIIDVEVSTRYFFDAPAGDIDLSWNLYGQDSYFYLPGYSVGALGGSFWSPLYSPGDSQLGALLDSGSGSTTPEGTFSIEVPAVSTPETQIYTLEVLVVDESGFPVGGRASATIHPASFYIGVRSDTWIGQAGTEMGFDVRVVDWDKNPAGVQNLTARISEVEWVRGSDDIYGYPTYEKRLTEIVSRDLSTDGQGHARLSGFIPASAGIYQLDLSGGGALTQKMVWVGGSGQALWPNLDNNQIRLIADKDTYLVDEIANVFIPNPFVGDALALISSERGIVLNSQVIEISGSGMTFDIPLSNEAVPNVYFSVALFGTEEDGSPGFRQGLVNLEVQPREQILHVAIVSQPERTGPGETVAFTVLVTDSSGTPVQGEFSLSVVDEAVLALADPFEEDIITAFYGIQSLGVHTSASLVASSKLFEYFVGGLGGGGGGEPEHPAIRSDFQDTAYWNAHIVTGSDGTAQVEAQLPDNLTTWQVLLRGLTLDTRVGEAVSEVVTTKDLLVRPVTPRFFVVGDHLQIGAVVHNNSAGDLQVDVEFRAKGFVLDDPAAANQEVNVPAGGRVRLDWWGTVEDVEAVELVFSAAGGGLQDVTLPAAGTLPVLRYTAPQTFATAGILEQGGERLELISLPRTFDPIGGGLRLEMSPSLAGTLLDALDVLEHYPYECTEQTVSRFLPNLEAYLAIQQFGLEAPILESRLDRTLKDGIIKLESEQHYNGGWGWSGDKYGKSDPYTTAYVFLGLVRAQQAGYSLQSNTLENAVEYLIEYLGANQPKMKVSWEYDRAAFIHFALSQANKPVIDLALSLYDFRDQMNPWGQALLALTFDAFYPGGDESNTLFSNLQSTTKFSCPFHHLGESHHRPGGRVG